MHKPASLCSSGFCRCDQSNAERWCLSTHDIDEAIMLADRVVVMTPRPCRIGAQLPVPVPRPRSVVTLTDPRFIALKGQILSMIYHDATTESATHENPA
ncbi:hypothetical protein JZM24_13620 [Candidatus Sodalis endolongispinus]|uniref:Uncharacterized protein n=1 Tax=Candidatus Sodalis endolongispinus TaxID=2812662 RepID=A0ABS5YD88_9GAMM|nr:hypothetical protein [Candidatus Sodalis endolongispinus]MBT9432913.1 hypothetical protein [Candidatus Sodalis endolongispinus]